MSVKAGALTLATAKPSTIRFRLGTQSHLDDTLS